MSQHFLEKHIFRCFSSLSKEENLKRYQLKMIQTIEELNSYLVQKKHISVKTLQLVSILHLIIELKKLQGEAIYSEIALTSVNEYNYYFLLFFNIIHYLGSKTEREY